MILFCSELAKVKNDIEFVYMLPLVPQPCDDKHIEVDWHGLDGVGGFLSERTDASELKCMTSSRVPSPSSSLEASLSGATPSNTNLP